jgi:ankyrin repeat protein
MLAVEQENEETLELLFQRGIQVNGKDDEGNTALIRAIQDGRKIEIVRTLLKHSASADLRSDNQDTALILAVKSNSESFGTLLNSPQDLDINAKNSDGKTALDLAAELGSQQMVKELQRKGAVWKKPSSRDKVTLDAGVLRLLREPKASWFNLKRFRKVQEDSGTRDPGKDLGRNSSMNSGNQRTAK